jgi:uncharacterized protein with PIN domain
VKEKKLTCPYCDGPLKLVKKTYQIGDILLHGTEMYECTLCEQVLLSAEQCHDTVRRVKRAKAKLKEKKKHA